MPPRGACTCPITVENTVGECPGRTCPWWALLPVASHLLVPVAQPLSCVWLYATPCFLVLHHFPEVAQTRVPWVGDAIQPSHPLSPPSSPALNLSQHWGLFQWVGYLTLFSLMLQYSPKPHVCTLGYLELSAAKSLQSCPTVWPHPWDSPGKNTGVGCHFLLQCIKVKSESEVTQSCLTLQDPMDCSLPGSSVHGIFQARVLEWGAIAFSVWNSLPTINTPSSSLPWSGPSFLIFYCLLLCHFKVFP